MGIEASNRTTICDGYRCRSWCPHTPAQRGSGNNRNGTVEGRLTTIQRSQVVIHFSAFKEDQGVDSFADEGIQR